MTNSPRIPHVDLVTGWGDLTGWGDDPAQDADFTTLARADSRDQTGARKVLRPNGRCDGARGTFTRVPTKARSQDHSYVLTDVNAKNLKAPSPPRVQARPIADRQLRPQPRPQPIRARLPQHLLPQHSAPYQVRVRLEPLTEPLGPATVLAAPAARQPTWPPVAAAAATVAGAQAGPARDEKQLPLMVSNSEGDGHPRGETTSARGETTSDFVRTLRPRLPQNGNPAPGTRFRAPSHLSAAASRVATPPDSSGRIFSSARGVRPLSGATVTSVRSQSHRERQGAHCEHQVQRRALIAQLTRGAGGPRLPIGQRWVHVTDASARGQLSLAFGQPFTVAKTGSETRLTRRDAIASLGLQALRSSNLAGTKTTPAVGGRGDALAAAAAAATRTLGSSRPQTVVRWQRDERDGIPRVARGRISNGLWSQPLSTGNSGGLGSPTLAAW